LQFLFCKKQQQSTKESKKAKKNTERHMLQRHGKTQSKSTLDKAIMSGIPRRKKQPPTPTEKKDGYHRNARLHCHKGKKCESPSFQSTWDHARESIYFLFGIACHTSFLVRRLKSH
jgi:hypothetical protein